ncbi:hypothetical protein T10_11051 [Trichinella papuae]|uniref:Uncharacterized protein n=1 Tax=Trichinella papuae TaxID=268474 RepID=A0A0V1M4A0_9BILA|nr:hypothetical protein T10_11434 [Trichinella papuae]KRZ66442.1 hypothetical protein T10_1516 [Trichinella papuae]KRZ76075.1 hypothetical protein T10_11051 [Trichinella papuae]
MKSRQNYAREKIDFNQVQDMPNSTQCTVRRSGRIPFIDFTEDEIRIFILTLIFPSSMAGIGNLLPDRGRMPCK